MSENLWRALMAHPAGPFQPKRKTFEVGGPIRFLGHELTVTNGVVRITAEERKLEKFQGRVKFKLTELSKLALGPLTRQKRLRELNRFVRSWCAAFKLCEGIEATKAHWLAQVKWATQV